MRPPSSGVFAVRSRTVGGNVTWPDYLTAVAAAGAVIAAIAIPLTAYARRPRLSLSEDEEGIHTRLEGGGEKIPWLRLVVHNKGWRRAAQGTRVLVQSYQELSPGATRVAMGSPELGWPSTDILIGGGVVVFAGGDRPLDFGYLARSGNKWQLVLCLAMHAKNVKLSDRREYLPPVDSGYTVRLLVGADDGAARTYKVDVNWDGDAASPEAALDSIQLAVRE